MVLALESMQDITAWYLRPLAPIDKIIKGTENAMTRYKVYSAIPSGDNTMFLQISKRYTPFSALYQCFPTLPII
jgi:hypothetical protein